MPTFVRLTDYKNSEEKEKGFFDKKNKFVANQEDFFKIPGAPLAYWVSDRVREIFANKKIEDYSALFQGIITGDNGKYLRYWYEISFNKITLRAKDIESVDYKNKYWVPYNKGGESRKWYGNQEIIVNFKEKGRNFTRGKHQFYPFFFKSYFSWTYISSTSLATRFFPQGFIWDVSGSGCFPKDEKNIFYFLGLIGSKVGKKLLEIINPTMNYQVENIAVVPVIFPDTVKKNKLINVIKENIDISKEEWDSRETSWDFRTNELVRMKNEKWKMENVKIEDVYNEYCNYWKEKFYKLHKNEEELNKLFIEIYGLENELTYDVPLEDITILKKEAKIENGELVFNKKEIIKQFISYFVGVLFGRYSLDKEGLVLVNLGEGIEEYLKQIPNPSFLPDDDNVVPVLEREYFEDDILSRFKEFVKVVFGEKYFSENMRFIENAVGDIRKYFNKEFYKDHIQKYKKRPIYWMVTSKNGAFKALIYMHRFKPDIFARVRNEYLLELIAKIESRIESLDKRLSGADTKEKKQIEKELMKLNKELKELYDFDKVLQKYANKTFEIDLDDGVKVNYCKFKEILYPISNLCKK